MSLRLLDSFSWRFLYTHARARNVKYFSLIFLASEKLFPVCKGGGENDEAFCSSNAGSFKDNISLYYRHGIGHCALFRAFVFFLL